MRTLYLFDDEDAGELTSKVAATFLRELDEVMEDAPRKLRVRLMTHGGSEDAAFAIYDALRDASAEVQVVGHGGVQSAGVLILQAGDERLLLPNSYLLLHCGEVSLSGPMEEVANGAAFFQHRDERVYSLLAQRTGLDREKVVEHHTKGLTVPSGQAVTWGYADKVLKPDELSNGTR